MPKTRLSRKRRNRPVPAALICGCLWVIAATIVALLPMRMQYPPGLTLLLIAPVLIIWIGVTVSPVGAAIGFFALVSMFRRPLVHIGGRFFRNQDAKAKEDMS